MPYVPKNYTTDDGDTYVVGGKLVIAEGGTIETAPGAKIAIPAASTTAAGLVKQAANVAEAAGSAPTAAEFKALLDALKAAGIMVADS